MTKIETRALSRPRTRRGAALPALVAAGVLSLAACHGGPPPQPPAPPPTLTDSESAALRWVDAHAAELAVTDSSPSAGERQAIASIASGARVIGLSELTEGTAQFPLIVRHAVLALADAAPPVRGLAIQAPMPEAMEIDRYVRTGTGDPRRLLRTLGSPRFETPEMLGVVEAIRRWNEGKGPGQQVGFYGFEIPNGTHAVATVLGLPDSVAGRALNLWMRSQLACVANDESAHWGLEGRASDSTYWNQCGTIVAHVADSIAALRARVSASSPAAARVAYADEMARLLRHYVSTGLRHLPREQTNAAHVMYLVNSLGADARLVLWGGDVEMGRLTLGKTTVQTGVPLGTELGSAYRAIAFAVGGGRTRTRRPAAGPMGNAGGYGAIPIHAPEQDTYEDVLGRATREAYWLDLRALPSDTAGTWLRGPRRMRLITDLYTPDAPQLFDTPLEFPKNYDAIVFLRTVTATR